MLFEHARPEPCHTIMILGAAGNVGAYAVQFAANAGFHVIAVVGSKDIEYVRSLGATDLIDYQVTDVINGARSVDVVIDTVGGETRERAFGVLKPGGILVTVVSGTFVPGRSDVRSVFFYAEVTTERLRAISGLLDSGKVIPHVGSVLPLSDVRTAHQMLAGAPHQRGKIVLQVAT
jgi:NADPH:quinone reductase-like Zn-dependent oxidoreductase